MTKVTQIDPVALIRWLAVTADYLGIDVKASDALIAAAKHDADNPTRVINVITERAAVVRLRGLAKRD